jgi:T6SS, Phospholipase effector Tle1-like, catalytic domain
MTCNACIILLITTIVVIAAVFLLAIKIVRILVGVLVLVALIAAVAFSVYVNEGGRIGIILGLLLGTLLGPVRLAGVDFRQWFMDPGAPSELGDDSFIGLIRWGFHALWIPWFVAMVALLCAVSWWVPPSCRLVDIAPFLHRLLDPIQLHGLAEFLADALSACSGFYGGVNIVLGVLLGVIVIPALVELIWHAGLAHGVPAPAPTTVYLAPQRSPRVRVRAEVAGRRRLVICCDGTWNWPESKRETNVVRMVRALLPDHNGVPQIIHYHEGVGTGNFLDRLVGGGAGVGLSASVKACYGFLADNYRPGDEIFLFGFSRGAFVVRSLAGMIGAVGMLRKDEMARFADVWNWYCLGRDNRPEAILQQLAPHRQREVDIECIGVWDTVGALGIPGTRLCAQAFEFHDTALGPHVRHAFQALAIDERRGNFQAAIWVPFDRMRRRRGAAAAATEPEHHGPLQVLKQMWFPGVHSNVGGGYPQHGMSDATFLWMLAQLDGLLGFNRNNIVSSLDNVASEFYPGGRLEDSRTLFWKLIASPVPRPVGIISATEQVHASALDRSTAASALVAANDVYKGQSRRDWLAAIGARTTRCALEEEIAGLPRPPDPPPVNIRQTLGVCGHILAFINPQG